MESKKILNVFIGIGCFILAVLPMATPVKADMYELIATPTSNNNDSSGFTVRYQDSAPHPGILDMNDTILFFSGIEYKPSSTIYNVLDTIPTVDGISYGPGSIPLWWEFSIADTTGYSYSISRDMFTYSNTNITVVPIPPAVSLLGVGLIGLALARRRKRGVT